MLFDLQQHGFLCRYLVINECPEVPACTTGSQPMWRQDRGDVGGGISSKVEELRMDASSKGLAWLREKVESMKRDDLQKVAAASGVSTRRQDGPKVAIAELRNALVEHFASQASFWGEGVWFREDFVSVVNGFLGSITGGVSVDSVGAVVWIVVFGGCSDSSLHRNLEPVARPHRQVRFAARTCPRRRMMSSRRSRSKNKVEL